MKDRDSLLIIRKLPRLIISNQRLDKFIQLADHYLVNSVAGKINSVIGHATLREVVSSDALRSVATSHLFFATRRTLTIQLFTLRVINARTQNFHGFFAVFNLRL